MVLARDNNNGIKYIAERQEMRLFIDASVYNYNVFLNNTQVWKLLIRTTKINTNGKTSQKNHQTSYFIRL